MITLLKALYARLTLVLAAAVVVSAHVIARLKAFYARLTPAQRARLWTLLISGMTIVAGSADKIVRLPWFPGWLANAWPAIVGVDIFLLKLIGIFTDPNAPTPNPNSTQTP